MSNDILKCVSCLHLTDDIYDHLVADSKTPLKWFCENCEQEVMTKGQNSITHTQTDKLDQLIISIEKLMGRYDNLERKLEDKCDTSKVQYLANRVDSVEDRLKEKCDVKWAAHVEDRMKDIDDRFTRHEQIMQDKVTTLAASMEEARKVDSDLNSDKVLECVEKVMNIKDQETKDEEAERNRRKTSVIVHGVAESGTDDSSQRESDDLCVMASMLQELECNEVKLQKITRLGKHSNTATKPRPLKLVLETEDEKIAVLKKAKNLRHAKEGGWEKVFIHQDLTPKEREVRKVLLVD